MCLVSREVERKIIVERTESRLASRARRRKGGRPAKLAGRQRDLAPSLLRDPKLSVREICQMFSVSKATLYRARKRTSDGQYGATDAFGSQKIAMRYELFDFS